MMHMSHFSMDRLHLFSGIHTGTAPPNFGLNPIHHLDSEKPCNLDNPYLFTLGIFLHNVFWIYFHNLYKTDPIKLKSQKVTFSTSGTKIVDIHSRPDPEYSIHGISNVIFNRLFWIRSGTDAENFVQLVDNTCIPFRDFSFIGSVLW